MSSMRSPRLARSRIPFALAAILASASAVAQTPEFDGVGSTEQAALENALLEAIRQTVGVVNQDSMSKKRMELVSANVHWLVAASADESGAREGIATATKGVVESYSVLRREKDGDVHRVRIAAKVSKRDAAAPRTEPFSVVVLPMRSAPGRIRVEKDGAVFDEPLDLSPLAEQVRKAAKAALVQSGAFTVLDREDLTLADAELARIRGGESSPQSIALLRQRLVADYLLLGEVASAEARLEAKSMSVPGWSTRSGHEFSLRYTVLEVPTGKILRTGTVESAWRSVEPTVQNEARIDVEQVFLELAGRTVPFLVDGFVGDIDPVMVAKVKDADGKRLATLTQGGSRFAVGDTFLAFELGEELTHPVTGASLGRDETILGEVRIVDTGGKLAVGEVTSGGEHIARGALLRRKPPAGVRLR
jgi:Curli production assembly/transport component CsgG